MIKKKSLAIILSIVILFTLMILGACTPKEEKILDASYYTYLTFTYNEDNYTASVKGNKSSGLLKGKIDIPEKVLYNGHTYTINEIMDSAFYNCAEIEKIIIPDFVQIISSNAFSDCDNLIFNRIDGSDGLYLGSKSNPYMIFCGVENKSTLTEFTLHNDCKFIMDGAFANCFNLSKIILSENLISVGRGVFSNVSDEAFNMIGQYKYLGSEENPYLLLVGAKDGAANHLSVRNTCQVISQGAFENRSDLTGVLTIPNCIKRIEANTFYGTGFTSLSIGEGVEYIGKFAFANSALTGELTLLDNVLKIDMFAFNSCGNITKLNIGNGVKELMPGVFQGCSNLKNISLGEKIDTIWSSAFDSVVITEVKLKSLIPPLLGEEAFPGIAPESLTIKVPQTSLSLYQQDEQWSKYIIVAY